MIIDETIRNLSAWVEKTSASDRNLWLHLRNGLPADKDPDTGLDRYCDLYTGAVLDWLPPVVVCPQWFLDEVRQTYGVSNTDYEVDELSGLRILQREDSLEPYVLLADGTRMTILPNWARRTAQQIERDELERKLKAGVDSAAAPPSQ